MNGKKMVVLITLLFMVSFMSVITSCSKLEQEAQNVSGENINHSVDIEKEEVKESNEYNYDLLYSYKNISLGDTDKIKELVNQLQYAKELSLDEVNIDDIILRINYQMSLTPGEEYKVNHTKMMADMVILFALLDDLNAIEYNLVQADYGYGGVPKTRKEAEEILGTDIGALGKTKETFLSEIPQKITELEWNPEVMSIITYDHIMGFDE